MECHLSEITVSVDVFHFNNNNQRETLYKYTSLFVFRLVDLFKRKVIDKWVPVYWKISRKSYIFIVFFRGSFLTLRFPVFQRKYSFGRQPESRQHELSEARRTEPRIIQPERYGFLVYWWNIASDVSPKVDNTNCRKPEGRNRNNLARKVQISYFLLVQSSGRQPESWQIKLSDTRRTESE